MAQPKSRLLLAAAAALIALGLLWAFVFDSAPSPAPEESAVAAAPELDLDNALDSGAGTPRTVRVEGVELADAELAVQTGPTRVLFPLEVTLELVRESGLPEVPSGPPLGSGRNARIAGRIADARGEPAQGEVRFVAGSNRGRALRLDSEGRFGANDLFPGLAEVQVEGPGLLGARREVRLASGQEALLNLGFGRPGSVSGRVADEFGQAIGGATVTFDGQTTTTDELGYFAFGSVAPGRVVVEVHHPGYAAWRSLVPVTHASTITADRLRVTLQRGATLNVARLNDAGESTPIELYIVPTGLGADRRFDWARFNPILMTGRELTIDSLPPVLVQVHAFREGAAAVPRVQNVSLGAGAESNVQFSLQPAPLLSGRVVSDERVVVGARVRLSAADPSAVASTVLGQPSGYMQAEVLPLLPPARQERITGDDGTFRLGAWSASSPWRLLEVESPDGATRRRLAIGPETTEIEVDLSGAGAGPVGHLRLNLPQRFQGLPIELVIDGRPRDPFELRPDEVLEIRDLPAGTWRLSARWWTEIVADLQPFEIEELVELPLDLPLGALKGQDDDTWARAGRPRTP